MCLNRNSLLYSLLIYCHPRHTSLLTPWSTDLLEKLTGTAASQEIPRVFGTRMFITVLTSARHLSLSWANSIQSSQPLPSSWRSILILSSHLRLGLPNGLFPSDFPTRTLCTPPPYAPHAPPISFFSILPPAQYSVRSTDHATLHISPQIVLLCYYLCHPMYWSCVLYHCHRVLIQLQSTNISNCDWG